jgi:TPR repeat protein
MALNNLAFALQDLAQQNSLYRKATRCGNSNSCWNLAINFDKKNAIESEKKEALKWYKKGAELGDVSCQFKLGEIYAKGLFGPEKSAQLAKEWKDKAIANGYQPKL